MAYSGQADSSQFHAYLFVVEQLQKPSMKISADIFLIKENRSTFFYKEVSLYFTMQSIWPLEAQAEPCAHTCHSPSAESTQLEDHYQSQ